MMEEKAKKNGFRMSAERNIRRKMAKGGKSTRVVKATVLYRDGKEREFEVESDQECIGVVASTFIETVMLMSKVHPELGIFSAEYRLVPKARSEKTRKKDKTK